MCTSVCVCVGVVRMRQEQSISAGGVVLARWGGASICDDEAGAWLRLGAATVQVLHGSVEGKPYSFSDVARASLRQLDSIECLVDPEGHHLGSRKPLPEREEGGQCVILLHPKSDRAVYVPN